MAADSSYVMEKPDVAAPIATDDSASGPLTIQNPIAKPAIGALRSPGGEEARPTSPADLFERRSRSSASATEGCSLELSSGAQAGASTRRTLVTYRKQLQWSGPEADSQVHIRPPRPEPLAAN